MSTIAAPSSSPAREEDEEDRRLGEFAIDRRFEAERLADDVAGRERQHRRGEEPGVENAEREDRRGERRRRAV